jgi:hypothetical protein
MTLLDATAFVLEAIMFTTFVALVFSAATGLRCELHIDDRQQVWHISADVEARAFTARSKSEKPIRAPRGDRWHPTAVARLLNRLQSTRTHV